MAGEQMSTIATTTPSIRERLNLGVHNNAPEEELLVVTVADPHKVECINNYHYRPEPGQTQLNWLTTLKGG